MRDKLKNEIKEKYDNWSDYNTKKIVPKLSVYFKMTPDEENALKALECKNKKDVYFSDIKRILDNDSRKFDFHHLEHVFRKMINNEEYYYKKRANRIQDDNIQQHTLQEKLLDFSTIAMKTDANENLNITADINLLHNEIYGECKTCEIKKSCNSANSILEKYIFNILAKDEN